MDSDELLVWRRTGKQRSQIEMVKLDITDEAEEIIGSYAPEINRKFRSIFMSNSNDSLPSPDQFRSPSEWVLYVVEQLKQRLNIELDSAYVREAKEPKRTYFAYQVGDSGVLNQRGNDGRKLHEIELRFLVYVPLAVPNFDLEALDAATRIEREFVDEFLGIGNNAEETRLVSNQPRKFDPKMGVFLRTVVVQQRIYMGKVEEELMEFSGSELNVSKSDNEESV